MYRGRPVGEHFIGVFEILFIKKCYSDLKYLKIRFYIYSSNISKIARTRNGRL